MSALAVYPPAPVHRVTRRPSALPRRASTLDSIEAFLRSSTPATLDDIVRAVRVPPFVGRPATTRG